MKYDGNEARQNHIICIFPLLLLLNCLFVHMTVNTAKCAPALRDGRPSWAIMDSSYPTTLLPQLLKKQGVTWRWKWPPCSLNGTAALETMNWVRMAVPHRPLADRRVNDFWVGKHAEKHAWPRCFDCVNVCVGVTCTEIHVWNIRYRMSTVFKLFGHVYSLFFPPQQMESPSLSCLQDRSACSHITHSEWHNMLLNRRHG